jgi:uncharacterized protein (TIGR02611 family)
MEERERRPRPKFVEKLEAKREDHAQRGLFYRILFGVAGATVLLAGLVMLVTPGPAFVLIPVGLAMLSMEFAWAAVALDKALEHAQIAQEKAAQTSTRMKLLSAVAVALGIAAVVAAAIHWNVGPF